MCYQQNLLSMLQTEFNTNLIFTGSYVEAPWFEQQATTNDCLILFHLYNLYTCR
jgi:hypothetical protein